MRARILYSGFSASSMMRCLAASPRSRFRPVITRGGRADNIVVAPVRAIARARAHVSVKPIPPVPPVMTSQCGVRIEGVSRSGSIFSTTVLSMDTNLTMMKLRRRVGQVAAGNYRYMYCRWYGCASEQKRRRREPRTQVLGVWPHGRTGASRTKSD